MDIEDRLALLEKEVKELKLQMTVLDLQQCFRISKGAKALGEQIEKLMGKG